MKLNRCRWVPQDDPLYIAYHDNEWGQVHTDDHYLFEFLILEGFQAGLSWACILHKRKAFEEAFDDFDVNKVANYTDEKLEELAQNKDIVRNRLKIKAARTNARIFLDVQKEYGSFSDYLWGFSDQQVLHEVFQTTCPLSDEISADLKKRGMKFVGSTIIYSYLQACGIINDHEEQCFRRTV